MTYAAFQKVRVSSECPNRWVAGDRFLNSSDLPYDFSYRDFPLLVVRD